MFLNVMKILQKRPPLFKMVNTAHNTETDQIVGIREGKKRESISLHFP